MILLSLLTSYLYIFKILLQVSLDFLLFSFRLGCF